MRILVRVNSGGEPGLAVWTRARLGVALGRFGGHVRSLTVSIRDINGPRGGVDQQCCVVVRLAAPSTPIVIEETAEAAGMAVSRAADRAARAVARAVGRVHHWRVLRPSD